METNMRYYTNEYGMRILEMDIEAAQKVKDTIEKFLSEEIHFTSLQKKLRVSKIIRTFLPESDKKLVKENFFEDRKQISGHEVFYDVIRDKLVELIDYHGLD